MEHRVDLHIPHRYHGNKPHHAALIHSDFYGLGDGLADMPHGGARFVGFEWRVGAVWTRDGELCVVLRDVGVGAWLSRGDRAPW